MSDIVYEAALTKAEEILRRELAKPEGYISLTMLGRFLSSEGFNDETVGKIFGDLKLKAGTADQADRDLPWFYSPRGFYTKTEVLKVRQQLSVQAGQKALEVDAVADLPADGKVNRQDEAKLCAYVKDALSTLYDRDIRTPNDVDYVFDVHNLRPESVYRNVDVLAVDWRDAQIVEIIAVEVKLDFNPESVQQASFYQRFAHRCWVAVLVNEGRADQAWQAVQKRDASLFEHAISIGLGVMACFTSQGGGYRVVPVHWPKLQHPDPVEQKRFIKAYRGTFEKAGVVPVNEAQIYPKVA